MIPLSDFDFWLGLAGCVAGLVALAAELVDRLDRRAERAWNGVDEQGRRLW